MSTRDSRNWALIARVAVGGGVAAATLFAVLVVAGWRPRAASELAFSLSGLVFSVGLIGWSTVLLSGDAIEGFSRQVGVSRSWTAAGGRQAMAVLTMFGAGGMVGASLAAAPFGA